MVVDEEIKKKMKAIAEKRGLFLAILFGSQATGKVHKQSDVDIAVLGEKPLSYAERYDIQMDFSKVFGRKDIEISDLRNISPLILKRVTDNGILLYSRNSLLFAELRAYAFKQYIETKRLRDLRGKFVDNFVKTHAR